MHLLTIPQLETETSAFPFLGKPSVLDSSQSCGQFPLSINKIKFKTAQLKV